MSVFFSCIYQSFLHIHQIIWNYFMYLNCYSHVYFVSYKIYLFFLYTVISLRNWILLLWISVFCCTNWIQLFLLKDMCIYCLKWIKETKTRTYVFDRLKKESLTMNVLNRIIYRTDGSCIPPKHVIKYIYMT